jgi:hypothetical protein
MNIYDFDGTLRKGDSSAGFYLFCLSRRPYLILLLPLQGIAALLYAVKLISITAFKQFFYSYFRFINTVKLVPKYWDRDREKIYSWYSEYRTENDVVVSASPEFLLDPICRELGIRKLIASNVDPKTGRYTGKNCSGEEKRVRFLLEFPDCKVLNSYYDRDSDLPVSRLAEHGYRIVDGIPKQEF